MARRDTTLVHRSEIAAFASDHGGLGGLTDDDHTQYHTDARALTWLQSQNVSELTNDAGYLSAGANITVLDGTANRLIYIDNLGDVQELAHGSSGQVLTSQGVSSAPAWATPTTIGNFQDNGLAGEGLYNSNVAFSTTASGVQLERPGGGGNTVLEINAPLTYNPSINMEVNNTTYLQLQYDNGVEGYLRLTTTGEGFRIFNTADGDLAEFTSNGAYFYPSTTANGHVFIHDSAGNAGGIRKTSTTSLDVFNNDLGEDVRLLGSVSSGGDTVMLVADPAGAVDLYYAGTVALSTNATGALLDTPTGTGNTTLSIRDGDNLDGEIIKNATTGNFNFRNTEPGGPVALQGRNTADTLNKTLLLGDPDAETGLYYDGNVALETQTNGIIVYGNAVANQSEIEMWDSTQLVGAIVEAGGNFTIYSNVNSSVVRLRGKTSGGANQLLFEGDPDVGVAFNGAGPFAAPTYSVTNVTTDRTYNANATTTAELADVLGTLIADLRSYGLVV